MRGAHDCERLRALGPLPQFEVALVEPEIPPNTGNIARLCAATQSPLHLVEPLGFRVDEKAVRRAGLDYWNLVNLRTHPSVNALLADYRRRNEQGRVWWLTGRAPRSYLEARFQARDLLVFGKESVGLPQAVLASYPQDTLGIPTLGAVRSLNLANSVAIVLYEALRQVGALESAELR